MQMAITTKGISENHLFIKKLKGIIMIFAIRTIGNSIHAMGAIVIDSGFICPAYAAKIVAPAIIMLIARVNPINMLRIIFIVIVAI